MQFPKENVKRQSDPYSHFGQKCLKIRGPNDSTIYVFLVNCIMLRVCFLFEAYRIMLRVCFLFEAYRSVLIPLKGHRKKVTKWVCLKLGCGSKHDLVSACFYPTQEDDPI